MPFSQSKKPGTLQLFAYISKPKKWYLPRIPAFSGGLFESGKAKGQPHKRLTCDYSMEPTAGLEPATHALRMRCSTN